MSIKFFEVTLPVRVRKSHSDDEFEEHQITVHVAVQDTATPEEAVRVLAEKLEKLCNDCEPYEGG